MRAHYMPATHTASLPTLKVRHGEDRRLAAGHLWIFSNEVDVAATPLTAFEPGELVRVMNDRDRFMGYAYVNPRSLIAARILSRDERVLPDRDLIVKRLKSALALRHRLSEEPYYRLVFGESDLLPGLVIDRYGDVLVVEIGTAGMERMKDDILAALRKVIEPSAVLLKNDSGSRELEGLPSYVETAFGTVPDRVPIRENGLTFEASLAGGQKTGWYYDQAHNRQALIRYVGGARVLDVCCYLGAWGIAAAKHGAVEATCVDSSASALEGAQRNATANDVKISTIKGDAFDVLGDLHARHVEFDIVVLDPPAFIKRRKDIPKGEAAYRKLNQMGMQLLARDGLLVSSSCSYHLPADDLLGAIARAGRNLNRHVAMLEAGGQAPDHPVHPAIPETRYLKTFFCRVVRE
jgi:23S rRNA (cytosine1962-C5)-methyltransferase